VRALLGRLHAFLTSALPGGKWLDPQQLSTWEECLSIHELAEWVDLSWSECSGKEKNPSLVGYKIYHSAHRKSLY
jgi:hypothetical protein